mmetsp:Transcript_39333/g.84979  ORF Transcript_39333/g.84979 Transcript_39333/m.84979 type:complete len:217 (+) Transcript_39333:918-1568(+)
MERPGCEEYLQHQSSSGWQQLLGQRPLRPKRVCCASHSRLPDIVNTLLNSSCALCICSSRQNMCVCVTLRCGSGLVKERCGETPRRGDEGSANSASGGSSQGANGRDLSRVGGQCGSSGLPRATPELQTRELIANVPDMESLGPSLRGRSRRRGRVSTACLAVPFPHHTIAGETAAVFISFNPFSSILRLASFHFAVTISTTATFSVAVGAAIARK